jgi:hypothetical protein
MDMRMFLPSAVGTLALSSIAWTQVREVDVPPPPPVVERTVTVAMPREVQIAGQVLRTKQVDDRTANEKMFVVQLDLGQGERQIADLGPTRIYKNVPIYVGDQIAVYGPELRLGHANVVLATEVHIGGDKITVPRSGVLPLAGYVVAGPDVKLYGRIEALRPTRLRDSRSEHWIARVVDRNGAPSVVDLGPQAALWRADLRAGDWITIYGPFMQIGDERVVLARELNKSGTPYVIARQLVSEPAARTAAVAERTITAAP